MVHRLLLFLTRRCCVESNEETCRIELEALGSKFGIDSDENHG